MDKKDNIANYDSLGTLGRGAYGEVILAKRKSDGQQFAIKILDKIFLAKEKKSYQVFIEKEVLQRVHHPGLINLASAFQTNDKLYFVLEFIEGGDFANFLKHNKSMSPKSIQFFTAQIVSILEALHTKGVAHRDVKPENIMLAKNLHLKMIDFGTASFFDESQLPEDTVKRIHELKEISRKDDRFDEIGEYQQKHKATFVGTAEYVSPELLEDDICSHEADLWALGCILYKMFTGVTPFNQSTEYLIFQQIKTGDFNKDGKIPPDALDLIQKLLQRNPNQRIGAGPPGSPNSMDVLKQHPFLKDIPWDQLWTMAGPTDVQLNPSFKPRSHSQDFDDIVSTGNDSKGLPRAQSSIQPLKSAIALTGMVNKKTGWMIYKARNMILYDYDQPRLEYFDPDTGVKKGQIELKAGVKIELLKGQFNIDVPNKKKYFFKECEHPATIWVQKIKEVMQGRNIVVK